MMLARAGAACLAASTTMLVATAAAAAGEATATRWWEQNVQATALVETEWALGTTDGSTQKAQLEVYPEVDVALPADASLTVIGRARGDIVDRLEPGTPPEREASELSRRLAISDRVELELREMYVRVPLGRAFVTIGKQQIVWGKADGIKVLDVVNPQDYREFILDDFDQSRIPLWSVDAEVPIGSIGLQLVWLPDRTYHDIPQDGALFEFTAPRFKPPSPPGIEVDRRPLERPHDGIEDSDAGLRLSSFWKGWDLTLNYLYHYNDIPVFFRRVSGSADEPVIVVEPRYRRSHLVGGTFSNAFGNLTVRGEIGYFFNHYFFTSDRADADGVVRSDELDHVIGLDWFGLRDALLSLQLFQTWVVDPGAPLHRDEFETLSTLFARFQFWNDTLAVQCMWMQSFNDGDGLLRPRLSYLARDNLELWLGLDWFYGTRNGLFGEFDQNDRIVIGAEWGIG